MSEGEKSPSALDYGAHLHELALASWTRAMLSDAPVRAGGQAQRLAESHEKLWRFIGLHHAGLAFMGAGQVSAAVDALSAALRCHSSQSPLTAATRRTAAHLHLETRSPRSALALLDAGPVEREDRGSRYFRALALARLERSDAAKELALSLDDLSARHIRCELGGELDDPRDAAAAAASAPWAAGVPALASMAAKLVEGGDGERATAVLETLTEARESFLHWPIAYVRSLYRLATIDAASGRRARAAENFSRFAVLWRDAEIDRREVAIAAQFSSA